MNLYLKKNDIINSKIYIEWLVNLLKNTLGDRTKRFIAIIMEIGEIYRINLYLHEAYKKYVYARELALNKEKHLKVKNID